MSNDPNIDYLASIGQRVLQEQLAAQQQQPPPMDTATAQRMRNQEIEARAARRAQDREIAMAREKDIAFEAQRQKQREKVNEEQARELDAQLRAEVIAEWRSAGLPLSSLDTPTMARLLQEKRLTHMEEYQKKLRSRSANVL